MAEPRTPLPGEIWWHLELNEPVAIRSLNSPLLPYLVVLDTRSRVQFAKESELRRATDHESEQYREGRALHMAARQVARQAPQPAIGDRPTSCGS